MPRAKQPELTPEQLDVMSLDELRRLLTPTEFRFAEAFLRVHTYSGAARLLDSSPAVVMKNIKKPHVEAYLKARIADVMQADEVLFRLTERARLDPQLMMQPVRRTRPVYESAPLADKIAALRKRLEVYSSDPEMFGDKISECYAAIADAEAELAADSDATYEKRVGTEEYTDYEPSLEAAAENGVLQYVTGIKYSAQGERMIEWAQPSDALQLLGKHYGLFTDKVQHSGGIDTGIKYIVGVSEDDL